VLAVYQAGIDTGQASLVTEAPTWTDFEAAQLPRNRFVALDTDAVTGWVAASAVSQRCPDAGVIEHGVYRRTTHPYQRAMAQDHVRAGLTSSVKTAATVRDAVR
jgi:L-amino acid N-acyltransferase YncA